MPDEIDRALALVCWQLFAEPSAHLCIGRHEIVRTIGRGGMGVVYEAVAPGGERVALKALRGGGREQRARLEREFRSLAEIQHPNLVAVRELVVDHDQTYFTMELVEGEDIVAHVRKHRGCLRPAFAQLAEAIRALHEVGKLHRDLKPANVRVTEEGRVVLLDFGLVEEASLLSDAEGTPAYMAPERFAGVATPQSDWYAFGCMLGEVVSAGADVALEPFARRLLDPDPLRRPTEAEITHMFPLRITRDP